jgi:hypothetical protein
MLPAARSGKARTALLAIVTVVVLLVILVIIAPTLVSLGLGQGVIRNAIQERVNGEVRFASLKLSWLGEQSMRDLQIVEPGGRTAVDVSVEASRGLFHIVRGAIAPLELRVTGRLEGTIEQDGSVSFAKLMRSDPGDGGGAPGAPSSAEPTLLPDSGPIDVILTGTTLQLEDTRSGRTITFEDVEGQLHYAPGTSTRLQLKAATESAGTSGSIDVQAEALDLVDARGRIDPNGAGLQINAVATSLPIPFGEVESVLDTLHVNVTTDDLTKQLLVLLDGQARVEGAEPSEITGRVVIDRPFSAAGEPTIALERITGTLTGAGVPTGLFAPVLAAAGLGGMIDPGRDLGPTVDIEAAATGGESGALSVSLRSQRLEAQLSGKVQPDDGTIDLETSRIRADVQPGLLAALADVQADRPFGLSVQLDRATFPGGSFGDAAILGGLRIESPVLLGMADRPPFGTVERLELSVATERLGEGIKLDGSGRITGADLKLDEVVTGLVADDGALTLPMARPVGRLELKGLPAHAIDRQLVEDEADGYLASMGATALDVELVTSERGSDLEANLQATLRSAAGDARVLATARETAEGIAVDSASVEGVVAPGLLARLQENPSEAVDLAEPATLGLDVEPFLVPGDRRNGFGRPTAPVTARLRSERLTLDRLPGLTGPVSSTGLDTTVTMRPPAAEEQDPTWAVVATTMLSTGPQHLGDVIADVVIPGGGGAPFTGTATLEAAAVGGWERMLGRERGSLRKWLGGRLTAQVDVEPAPAGYRATVRPQSPTLGGTFVAAVGDDAVVLSSEDATFTVRRGVLVSLLSGQGMGDEADETEGQGDDRRKRRLRVPTELALQLALNDTRLPMALLRGEPLGDGDVRIDVGLTGGPLELIYPDRTTAALRDIDLTLRSTDLREGVALGLRATSASGERRSSDEQQGTVVLDGRFGDLLDESGAISIEGGRLELDSNLEGLPTAIVDAMAGFNGLLTDALGPRIDARIVASDFSREGGTIDADIRATHGSLKAAAAGGDNALRSVAGGVATAELELTPALRQRLLSRIHPIFGDVRTVDQPLRAKASNVVLPLDGDVSRLQADLELTVGNVELDSGSLLLGLIEAFDKEQKPTIQGSIEPVRATIRDGVVRYERFAMNVDKYSLVYTGQIDLNTKRLDLRTEIPLTGLAASVKELRGIAENITVPLVTTGTLDDHKTEPDLTGVSESAIGAGLQGLFNELQKKLKKDG